ncbi:hypothetical protein BZG35_04090 [Brevundimonas sp. LM2]|uniref:hypothetical protein n=1 Tax=Brevundimonas sp. LM2 TaxID=1938605 RepID=UPI000983FD2D|nr:hypothetical protein [Brevundimonas sp. LM2]AQR60923.1 hypothetical protein BZG35_04090 [Brevundimonas sp. LM2]
MPTPEPTPTPYVIEISLPSDTVTALKGEKFALHGFKAVKSRIGGAAPLVWFSDPSFLTTTKVAWTEQYQAYISDTKIISDGTIVASAAADITLGQTANVDVDGNLETVSEGTASAISILNESSTQYTAGISQKVAGSANPMCAIPLHGNMLDVVVPIEKVLLTFASRTVNTGTVIYKAYAPSLLIDLTEKSTRKVNFDINEGWSWDDGTWATPIKAQADLVPLLIHS